MSKQNIQVQNSLLSSIPKNTNEENNEQIAEEINNLKHLVLQLEKKHLANSNNKTNTLNLKIDNQSQQEELQLKQPKHTQQYEIKYGIDIFKDINQKFKSRIINKKTTSANQTHQYTLTKREEKGEEEQDKYIIYSCENEKKQAIITPQGKKLDSQQQQPAKTQFFEPTPRKIQSNPIEFHFKKVDLLPIIDEDTQKFKSYMRAHRQKQSNNRYRMTPHSISKSNNKNYNSQPIFQSKKEISHNYLANKFPQSKIGPNSTKQQLIDFAKSIFSSFLPSFTSETPFTIKKYKNCIIFSLLPQLTKAIIYYFNQQVFFGNISINDKAKVQKNGPGIQYSPEKHFYQGYFINGRKNGKGKIIYKNGDEYQGQWLDGEIHGQGVFLQRKINKRYEGFWRKGQYCGDIVNTNIFNTRIN